MRIAVVDGNNLAFKSFAAMKASRGGLLKNSVGIPTTVLFSLLRTFNDLVKRTKFDRIIICWDISGSYYRRGIFPLYKKHRKYIDMKDYFEELDAARDHFKILGINQLIAKGIEADDLIGFLAHRLIERDHNVVIISDDKDFYQVVRPKIKIWRPIKSEYMTYNEVIEEFGLKPWELPRIKAITGEDSDFIPGVAEVNEKEVTRTKCGLGDANAIKIIKDRKNLIDAINRIDEAPKCVHKWKDLLIKKKKMILKSYKLARIRIKEKHYLDWEKELLKDAVDKVMKQRPIKIRNVIRLKNFLEFKTLDLVGTLRGIGVNVIGGGLK